MAHVRQESLIDLSHVIEEGMATYKGFPGPKLCDYWTREASAAHYDDGSSFQIGRIDMVANTGTYVDSPFHRYEGRADLAALPLESLADLDALVVRRPFESGLDTGAAAFSGLAVGGKAVLIHTGWDRHWRTREYFDNHPYLATDAANWLVGHGAAFVGIDSYNIDDTRARARPVHTILLGAGIPICEHMTNLGSLPDSGFRVTAVPPKISGMGSFPVRAFARLGTGLDVV